MNSTDEGSKGHDGMFQDTNVHCEFDELLELIIGRSNLEYTWAKANTLVAAAYAFITLPNFPRKTTFCSLVLSRVVDATLSNELPRTPLRTKVQQRELRPQSIA